MKLVFCWDDRQLLSVHIVGDIAGELIHLWQSVTDRGDTIDRFINTPFAVSTRS
jgi:pyruvate/2-oxoglutarate dehydrogenase complex dihydrolipoamide dehydrogenase (E3) component